MIGRKTGWRPAASLCLLGRLALFGMCAFFLSGCEGGGNSGSETTNGLSGLTGTVKDVEGRPIQGARVSLLAEDFNASPTDGSGDSLLARTDTKGVYLFPDVAPGRYNLELADSAAGTLSLIQEVIIVADSGRKTVDGTLGRPGSMDVRIADFLAAGESGYLYLPGTTVLLKVDSAARASGSVHLQSVPVGKFDKLLLVVQLGNDRKIVTVAEAFEIQSEATAPLEPFKTWKYSRKVTVNTSSTGLAVAGKVTDFPLLVRLNAGNFDFSQAQENGQDLRFSKADGTPIPFQIERWDASAKKAEVWARMDTVKGADAGQYINMHWGRSLITGDLPGPKVFDPAAGFAAVWHLDEAATEDAGGYKDATANANNLTAVANNPDAQAIGTVAGSKHFTGLPQSSVGTLQAAVPKGLGGNSAFTVTFWMKFELTAKRSTVLDFGTLETLKAFHFLLRPDSTTQFGGMDRNRDSGTDPATWQNVFNISAFLGTWTHIATVYDPAKGTVTTYCNGVKMQETVTPPLQIDPAGGLRIGRILATNPADSPFMGDLDELRFYSAPLSADFIKLDYETQKP